MKLTETKNGTIIEVFVKPNQSEFKLVTEEDEIVIFSTEEPVKGRANKEIVRELTKLFQARVELISGSTSKQKRLIVDGLSKKEIQKILTDNTPAH